MKIDIKNIICTTDFSDFSNHAIPFGISLAREFGAKLHLCHVIDISSTAMYGEGFADPFEQQKRISDYAQDHLNELMGDMPIDWEPVISVGNTANDIARVAEEKNADLVVAATHGRAGLKRVILGSVTERLMRTLPCPLFVVRSREKELSTPVKGEIRMKRILVGSDFSPDSSLAIQYGLSLAQEFQSELHLAHVIEPAVYEDMLKQNTAENEAYEEDLRGKLAEELSGMVPEEVHHWCTPKTVLLAGQAHDELIKYSVVQKIDLIILGVRGHSLVESLLMGSTTDRVIRQAPCPVLSVRPTTGTA